DGLFGRGPCRYGSGWRQRSLSQSYRAREAVRARQALVWLELELAEQFRPRSDSLPHLQHLLRGRPTSRSERGQRLQQGNLRRIQPAQTAFRNRDQLLAQLGQGSLPECRTKAAKPRLEVKLHLVRVGDRWKQLLNLAQGLTVVEDSAQKSRQRPGQFSGHTVRTANLHHLLDANLGKERREVVHPIRVHRRLSLKALLQQAAEGEARLKVLTAPAQEQHWRLERPFGVGAVGKGPIEHRRQVSAPGRIHVGPDEAPVGHPTGVFAAD